MILVDRQKLELLPEVLGHNSESLVLY